MPATTPSQLKLSPAAQAVTDTLGALMFRLYQQHPFWGLLLEKFTIRVIPEDHPRIWLAAVDPFFNIYINPRGWRRHDTAQQAFTLAHEVAHRVFKHHERMGHRDPEQWNVDADLSINYLLVEEMGRAAMYLDGYYSSRVGHLTTEDLYALREGDESPQARSEAAAGHETEKASPVDGGREQKGSAPKPTRDESLDVRGRPGTADDVLAENSQRLRDAHAAAEIIREARDIKPENEDRWKDDIARARVNARMQGLMPAGLDRSITQRLTPQVNWAEQFQSAIQRSLTTAGRRESAWLPPNRRFIGQGLLLPDLRTTELPKVAFVADTSGSRTSKHLAAAYSEIDEARRLYESMVYVLDCDADVHTGTWVPPHEELPPLVGGGGTDFRPIFKHLQEAETHPDLCVIFTDTWGEFPAEEPEFPTLWVVDVPGARIPDWRDSQMIHINV